MKKSLTTLFVLFSLLAHGQFNKGDKFLGGSTSFYTHQSKGESDYNLTEATSFAVSPTVGFFIKENLALGGTLGFSAYRRFDSQQLDNGDSYNRHDDSNSLSASFFAKKFFTISDKFLFTILGGVSYGRGTTSYQSSFGPSDTEHETYKIGTHISPSFIFFPSPKWGIEASLGTLGFNHSKDLTNDDTDNHFGFDIGSFSLGFAYYFRK